MIIAFSRCGMPGVAKFFERYGKECVETSGPRRHDQLVSPLRSLLFLEFTRTRNRGSKYIAASSYIGDLMPYLPIEAYHRINVDEILELDVAERVLADE